MVDIEILHVDLSRELEAIKAVREITGWDLADAKAFIEGINDGAGSNTLKQIPPERAQEVILRLTEVGVEAKKVSPNKSAKGDAAAAAQGSAEVWIRCPQCGAPNKENVEHCRICNFVLLSQGEQSAEAPEMNEEFVPIASPDEIQDFSREKTLEVLEEARKIAETSEYYEVEIPRLQNAIAVGNRRAEEMRTAYSGSAKMLRVLIIVAAFLLFCLISSASFIIALIISVVVGFVAWGIVASNDLEKHKEENNANADKHIKDYVKPLEDRLATVTQKKDVFFDSGRIEWAKDVVGDDLFYSACIADLYNLIKSRRADSLKEALNKYDDELHKQHMEEMQKAIQNASEVSAKEAVKQTAHMGKIEKNTHQAATAAKITAATSYGTYRNTKKINKKL